METVRKNDRGAGGAQDDDGRRGGAADAGNGDRHTGGWQLLLLALLRGLAGPGLFSSLGVFFPLIVAEGGGSLGALSLSVSLASVAGACFLPLAGRLYERFDFRRVTFFGVLLMTLPYALYAVSPAPLWRAFLSVPLGCGMVMLVNLMAPCYLRLLGADTGSSLGVLVALSGLAGAAFQLGLAVVLHARGWRTAYWTFGLLCLAVMAGALFLLPPVRLSGGNGFVTRRGDTEDTPMQGRRSEEASAVSGAPGEHTSAGLFWSMFLFQGVITGFSMFHQHFSTFAAASALAHSIMTLALTLSMLASALGAFVLGWLTRRFGSGITGVGTLALGAVSVLLFGFMGRSTAGFLTAAAIHGAVSGAIGVTVPAAAREVYPQGRYARSLSHIMVSSPLFTLLFMQVYGVSYDRTGDFGAALLCLLAVLVGAAAVWSRAFVKRREKRRA